MDQMQVAALRRDLTGRFRVPGIELGRIFEDWSLGEVVAARDFVAQALSEGRPVGYVPAMFYRALELRWWEGNAEVAEATCEVAM